MKLIDRHVLVFATILVVSVCPGRVQAETLRIGHWNLEWFFDSDTSDNGQSDLQQDLSAPSESDFDWRVDRVSDAINTMNVDILGLEEVENRSVVQRIADNLRERHNRGYQVAFVQGKDTFTGQDVAMLIRDGLGFSAQRFSFDGFSTDDGFKNLSKHLHVTLSVGGEQFDIVVVHLITNQAKRKRQAKTLRAWTEDLVSEGNVIVMGDFNVGLRFENTFPDSDIGIIRGFGSDETTDDLKDLHEFISDRVTHLSGKQLDRTLISPSLHDDSGWRYSSIENRRELAIRGSVDSGAYWATPEIERDLSDHFPLIATFVNEIEIQPVAISAANIAMREGLNATAFDLSRNPPEAGGALPQTGLVLKELKALREAIEKLETRISNLEKRRSKTKRPNRRKEGNIQGNG